MLSLLLFFHIHRGYIQRRLPFDISL